MGKGSVKYQCDRFCVVNVPLQAVNSFNSNLEQQRKETFVSVECTVLAFDWDSFRCPASGTG